MDRIENPVFEYEPDVASALDQWTEVEQRARDEEAELVAELAADDEELEVRHRLARFQAETAGIEESTVRRVEEIQARKLERVKKYLDARIRPRLDFPLIVPDPPEPVSHDFWWARTESFHSNDFQSTFRNDGLAFFGGPNGTPSSNWLGDTDLIYAHFGAVA